LFIGAFAWSTLLGDHRIEHVAALVVSQIGKYVPGGVFQATGQLALARAAGIPVRRAATVFTAHAVTQAVAGGAYLVLLSAVWTSGSVWLRVAAGVGGLALLTLLDRRWMVWALKKIPRAKDASEELVPPQSALMVAWAAAIVTLATNSAAFLVILGSFDRVHDPILIVAAYATAWTVGFLLLPIPSGLGVREAVLVGILHGLFPASVLVAASVFQRLVTVGTEGLAALAVSRFVRPARMAALRDEVGSDTPPADTSPLDAG
jgi:hypothetical protein